MSAERDCCRCRIMQRHFRRRLEAEHVLQVEIAVALKSESDPEEVGALAALLTGSRNTEQCMRVAIELVDAVHATGLLGGHS